MAMVTAIHNVTDPLTRNSDFGIQALHKTPPVIEPITAPRCGLFRGSFTVFPRYGGLKSSYSPMLVHYIKGIRPTDQIHLLLLKRLFLPKHIYVYPHHCSNLLVSPTIRGKPAHCLTPSHFAHPGKYYLNG